MKLLRILLILCVLIPQGIYAKSKTTIPTKLHGYWQFETDEADDWDGILIGENYAEIFYDLCKVQKVEQNENRFTLYLTHFSGQSISMHISPIDEDKMQIAIPETGLTKICKRYDINPDIKLFSEAEYQNKIPQNAISLVDYRDFISLKNNKLHYKGKLWTIRWMGEYMGREYRALLQNKNDYILLYINKLDDIHRFVHHQKETLYKPADKVNKNLLPLLGNWYEPVSNEWIFGFYEHFAVYKNQFWDYESQSMNKKGGSITLRHDNEKLQLSFKNIKDSLAQISINGNEYITHKKAGLNLPDYTSKDTTNFADNHFAQIDTAYIRGYFPNHFGPKVLNIHIYDFIRSEGQYHYSEIDSLGRFEIKVPLYNSTTAYFDPERMRHFCVLEPNEHYFFYYDAIKGQKLVMGDKARIQNEYIKYNMQEVPLSCPIYGIEVKEIFEANLNSYEEEKNFITNYLNSLPNPSLKLKSFLKSEIKHRLTFGLFQQQYYLDRSGNDSIYAELIKPITEMLLSDIPKPITINRDFLISYRDYESHLNKLSGIEYSISFDNLDVLFELIEKKIVQPAKPDLTLLNEYRSLLKSMMAITDTTNVANKSKIEKAKKWLEKNEEKISKTYEAYQEIVSDEIYKQSEKHHSKKHFNFIDSISNNQPLRDYLKARYLYYTINNKHKALDEDLFQTLIAEVKTPAFKQKVQEIQDFYKQDLDNNFNLAAILQNTDHLQESKDADKIWEDLIAPYKGKIIYIDFWGSWCGPCMSEMEYVAELKSHFKDKDVVFMYFANNTPLKDLERAVQLFSLDGDNTVHFRLDREQQGMIERRLGINSFPTFLLVDREGKIVDNKAPRPSYQNTTVNYLNKWLEK